MDACTPCCCICDVTELPPQWLFSSTTYHIRAASDTVVWMHPQLEKGNAAAAADIERELERKPSLQAQQQQLMECASACQAVLVFLLMSSYRLRASAATTCLVNRIRAAFQGAGPAA